MKSALDLAELQRRAEAQLTSSVPIDDVLSLLRASGCNVIESIKIVCAAAGISRTEAKQLVHDSATWSDQRRRYAQLHDAVERLADEGH